MCVYILPPGCLRVYFFTPWVPAWCATRRSRGCRGCSLTTCRATCLHNANTRGQRPLAPLHMRVPARVRGMEIYPLLLPPYRSHAHRTSDSLPCSPPSRPPPRSNPNPVQKTLCLRPALSRSPCRPRLRPVLHGTPLPSSVECSCHQIPDLPLYPTVISLNPSYI